MTPAKLWRVCTAPRGGCGFGARKRVLTERDTCQCGSPMRVAKTQDTKRREAPARDDLGELMRYEDGSMSEEEAVAMFQRLIDSGLVWSLQGSYGRTARNLIDAGLCTPPAAPKED